MTLAQADQAARDGMDRALRAERVAEWRVTARRWLLELATGEEFTADDLVAVVGLVDPSTGTGNNVVGAFVSAQAKAGRIEWTGRFRKSGRVVGHGNLQRIWRRTSLVETGYEGMGGTAPTRPVSTSERVADTPPVAVAPCGARSLAPEQLTLEATA